MKKNINETNLLWNNIYEFVVYQESEINKKVKKYIQQQDKKDLKDCKLLKKSYPDIDISMPKKHNPITDEDISRYWYLIKDEYISKNHTMLREFADNVQLTEIWKKINKSNYWISIHEKYQSISNYPEELKQQNKLFSFVWRINYILKYIPYKFTIQNKSDDEKQYLLHISKSSSNPVSFMYLLLNFSANTYVLWENTLNIKKCNFTRAGGG